LVINKELTISIDTNLDNAVARRVSFKTENNHIFYLEFAMDKTEFIRSADFEMDEEFDLDSLIETHGKTAQVSTVKSKDVLNDPNIKGIVVDDADDLLSELGL
jgi:hypothetical protein